MNIIEEGLPFSESLLWKLQYNAYQKSGPRAWKISNNPYIARAFAWQTIAALRDWESELIAEEPVYLLEIGAGAGRFSYLYLHALIQNMPFKQRICLVISDNVDDYYDFWINHPKLKPLIDQGLIDFAQYDPTKAAKCELMLSGVKLEETKNPVIAITNYFYAALPNDLFRCDEGELFEGYPVIVTNGFTHQELLEQPKKMKEVEVMFKPRPLDNLPRYPNDPGFDDVLQSIKDEIAEGTPFIIPVEAMRTIRNLKELSSGRLLILSADKAFQTCSELEQNCDHRPMVTDLGDVNVDVNGYALKIYTKILAGDMQSYPRPAKTDYRDVLFNHWIIHFGKPGSQAQDMFKVLFEKGFNPMDCHKLIDKALSGDDEFTMDQILSLIQLSNYDPQLLYFYRRLNIKELFESLEESHYHVQFETMTRINDHFYWINKEDDILGYLLAQGFYYSKQFEKCRKVLYDLISLSGDSDQYRYFLGLSYFEEGKQEMAKKEFEKTYQLNPSHPLVGKYLT